MISGARDLVLARGVTDANGARHRRVRLLPIEGRAESFAAQDIAGHTYAEDELLASRLERIGGFAPATPELVGLLSIADRNRLALEIHADIFGDRLMLTTTCENPSCGEEADIDLSVSKLIGAHVDAPDHVKVSAATASGTLSARPPSGHDNRDVEDIWPELLSDGSNWTEVAADDRQRLALEMARRDGRPDLGIAAPCPSCGLLIELEIDPFELLTKELRLSAARLTAEIHCLAFHYGWSDPEILALPRARRWRFLELIGDELAGRTLSETWR